ncbi:MarC family protein [Gracilinema caldarium]|uniref:MarC family protein n=1 Tax=Gracilinema caldarium TaxID=215591 RepID=UPI0026F1D314|nr:MarC family protein [Gracilinema caldarium]
MLSLFIQILFTIFIVIDPFGLVPMYIGLTARLKSEEKKRTIKRAVFTAFVILSLFIIAGKWLLLILNIHPGSFFIAGGIMLFIVSLEMLFGQANRSKVSSNENPLEEDEDERTSVAIFPLAIPMLAGPGAITTILLFTSSTHPVLLVMPMLFVAVILTLTAAALAMGASEYILKALGRTGVSVIERIMGLLLSGLSVQFVYDGLVKLGVLVKVIQ